VEPVIEQREIDRFGREIRAAVKAADDPEGFAAVVQLQGLLDELLHARAGELREKDGYSWADLGRALGVDRTSAQQRWGGRRRVRRKPD
jgi:hypothetical protein